MYIDDTSDTWTQAQAIAFREYYIPILAGTSLIVCVFAQITFYIFPRLRIFPRSLLSWINMWNIYYLVYILFRWIPGFPWHSAMISNVPGSALCRFNVFLDVSSITGQYLGGTLLCFSLFLTIVRHVDLEKKHIYYWSFLASMFFIPLAQSIPAVLVRTSGFPGGSCEIADSTVNILVRSPYMLMLVIQIILVSWTMKHIKKVFSAVRANSTALLPIRYLFVRFIATIIASVFNLLPLQIQLTFPDYISSHAIFVRFGLISHNIGPILDASVLIFGNSEFIAWIFTKFSNFRKISTNYKNQIFPADGFTGGKLQESGRTTERIELVILSSEQILSDEKI